MSESDVVTEGSGQPDVLPDFYDLIPLDRDESTEHIAQALKKLELQLKAKLRPGVSSEGFAKTLEYVRAAKPYFADDDVRESYDLKLARQRHQGGPKAEPVEIDWVSRAWNYYFMGDDGAAEVAARKAREQHADNPMAFVVSAWVHLRDTKDEMKLKAAKRDADEAFVLGADGDDASDVYEVRGTVFSAMGEYEKAIRSFDRALQFSSPDYKPVLLRRKGTACFLLKRFGDAIQACLEALDVMYWGDLESINDDLRRDIDNCLGEDIVNDVQARSGSYEGEVAYWKELRQAISSANILPQSKDALVSFCDANLGRLMKLADKRKDLNSANNEYRALIEKRRELEKIKDAEGYLPEIPLKQVVAVVVAILLAGAFGLGSLAAIAGLGCGGYVVWALMKRSAWSAVHEKYWNAQQQAAQLDSQASQKKNSVIDSLERQIAELSKTTLFVEGRATAGSGAVSSGEPATAGSVPAKPGASSVILVNCDTNKIEAIRIIREYTHLGLKEARELIEHLPQAVIRNVSNGDALDARDKFAAAGCEAYVE